MNFVFPSIWEIGILEPAAVGLCSHFAAEKRTQNIEWGLGPANIETCCLQTIVLWWWWQMGELVSLCQQWFWGHNSHSSWYCGSCQWAHVGAEAPGSCLDLVRKIPEWEEDTGLLLSWLQKICCYQNFPPNTVILSFASFWVEGRYALVPLHNMQIGECANCENMQTGKDLPTPLHCVRNGLPHLRERPVWWMPSLLNLLVNLRFPLEWKD